jgi:hypothetical protein
MSLSPRRYYLLKWRGLEDVCEHELALLFMAKQAEIAGTALPSDFPGRAALSAAGYTALEDVRGAEVEELVSAGLDEQTAERAIAAAGAP